MNQLTVKQLHAELQAIIEKGGGDRLVILSDDNEGNGYHGCFISAEMLDPKNGNTKFVIDHLGNSVSYNPNQLVVIG